MMSKIYSEWWHRDANAIKDRETLEFDNGYEAPIIRVNSIHALNTLVGYCKHIYESEGHIYFRGQSENYKAVLPSLYRGITIKKSLNNKKHKLNVLVEQAVENNEILKKMDKKLIDPLLQHYGVKTDWLDLVDNLWVALWFTIHDYIRAENDIQYEYVTKLRLSHERTYLYLVLADATDKHTKIPGYYKGLKTEIVDLRSAVPSVFLRPHNQHAILMRKRDVNDPQCADMAEQVKLVIELEPKQVKEWIGSGRLLSVENIYPSPVNDQGYSILLKDLIVNKEDGIGSITLISSESFI